MGKSYHCSQCDKAFLVYYAPNNHIRTHTGERLYQCSQCDNTFTMNNIINYFFCTIPDTNHYTWWLELTEWHTLPRIKKFATKPGERSEPRRRSRPSQYLRHSRSEATSRTSLPVLSQRELVIFDKKVTSRDHRVCIPCQESKFCDKAGWVKRAARRLVVLLSNITNSLWERTGKLVQPAASLLEAFILRYCNKPFLHHSSLRSPNLDAN